MNIRELSMESKVIIPSQLNFTLEVLEVLKKNVDKSYAIIVFDIDNFKNINKSYGTDEGNRLLKYIDNTLTSMKIVPNVYCRLYADNFALLFEYKQESDISVFTITLAEEISKYPLKSEISVSFGACKVEDCETAVSTLCEWASLAKKTVKGNKLKLLAFFNEYLLEQEFEEKKIEKDLDFALKNNELVMYLQPKLSIDTTEVVGAQALVRWIHPKRGMISLDRFTPLFEKNGFVVKMEYYIWEKAFATIRKWEDEGFVPIPISIKISSLHIHNDNLPQIFAKLAEKYQVQKSLIVLEMTETTIFDNPVVTFHLAQDLKREGFTLSMDSFGSGHSSLNLLKDVPVDVIKIDKDFMRQIVATERGKTVIQYSIAMVKKLNIDVVAEGVESFMQAQLLYEAGCDTAQGAFYSNPLPIQRFEQYTFGYCHQ